MCFYILGKFIFIIFYWIKVDLEFRFDNRILLILKLGREDFGLYVCNVENIYSSGNKGIVNVIIEIDV